MDYAEQDAQEFLRYLLEGLHEDVKRITERSDLIFTEIDEKLSDHEKAQESWSRYLRIEYSIIVDNFVGQLKSTLSCSIVDIALQTSSRINPTYIMPDANPNFPNTVTNSKNSRETSTRQLPAGRIADRHIRSRVSTPEKFASRRPRRRSGTSWDQAGVASRSQDFVVARVRKVLPAGLILRAERHWRAGRERG
ncbi:unnamed protein product [Phaedon cochleariae]|uniref:ubiquitinyl hydrolase 1 n=1 Tax=Phaedon cochleariae TaxID=80249 RepID=A0A9N9S9I5_PHACE|nr:unnamed protein product [Phaedon cochleariae]